MKPASAKAKGSGFERHIAQIFRDEDLDKTAVRQPLSGASIYKGDIKTDCGWSIECKKQEKMNMWKWIEQAKRQSEQEGQPFALIFSRNNERSYVCLDLYDWIYLMKDARQPKSIAEPTRQLKYDLERLKEAAKKVIKQLK